MSTIPPDHEYVSPGQVAPDRPPPDACMLCGESKGTHYFRALHDEEDAVRDALAHVNVETIEGRITVRQAADERVKLLEDHLERLRQLRVRYLGNDTP